MFFLYSSSGISYNSLNKINVSEGVSSKNSWLFCPITTAYLFLNSFSSLLGEYPNTERFPELGAIIPVSIFISVVFPAPFRPISPINSPFSTVRSNSDTAFFSVYFLLKSDFKLPLKPASFSKSLYIFVNCFISIIFICFSSQNFIFFIPTNSRISKYPQKIPARFQR